MYRDVQCRVQAVCPAGAHSWLSVLVLASCAGSTTYLLGKGEGLVGDWGANECEGDPEHQGHLGEILAEWQGGLHWHGVVG